MSIVIEEAKSLSPLTSLLALHKSGTVRQNPLWQPRDWRICFCGIEAYDHSNFEASHSNNVFELELVKSQGKRPLLRRMQQVCCSIRHLQCLESGTSAFPEFGIPLAVVWLETWNRRQRSEQRAKPPIDAMPGLSRQPKRRSRSRARVLPLSSVPCPSFSCLPTHLFPCLASCYEFLC